ncbi:MAG: imidazoleglycerol-phosphate dehydratase HisB, partial [Alphaproteobacteria bacterium]|nr:imidazoleglycerol-phosphate dehydratase HisB [Alphaproteobacteria bacterium]
FRSLAGDCVGCVIAGRELVQALRTVLPPYPLAQSAVRAALDALSPAGLAQSNGRRATIIAERSYLSAKLVEAENVVRVYPSQANFLFVETTDAAAFMARLRRFDIQVRSMDSQKKGAVRIAIGSPAENDLLLQALGLPSRQSKSLRRFGLQRTTKETAIDVTVDLDTSAPVDIDTGLGFFDHMLDQLATHGGVSLTLRAVGDLQVDAHHTIEDCALALGETIKGALGDKKGVARFGFTAPLDESVAEVVLDLSGRPFVEINAAWPATPCDGMGPDLVEHFFRSFATSLGATMHIAVKGENTHHMIEACFKAVGRALRQAFVREGDALPSTKGVL